VRKGGARHVLRGFVRAVVPSLLVMVRESAWTVLRRIRARVSLGVWVVGIFHSMGVGKLGLAVCCLRLEDRLNRMHCIDSCMGGSHRLFGALKAFFLFFLAFCLSVFLLLLVHSIPCCRWQFFSVISYMSIKWGFFLNIEG